MNPTHSTATMDHVYAIIMAGGSGERFWPLSTSECPKQFLRLLGEKSLFRRTVERIEPLIPIERQIVVAGEQHAERIRKELPDLPPANLICEPVGRNTAASIGLASLFVERRDPDSIVVVLPADHYIPESSAFLACVEKAIHITGKGNVTVVIGVRPNRPETGYGYVEIGPAIEQDVYRVHRFHEKPDSETAQHYLDAGVYLWNAGIFVWQNRMIGELMQSLLPAQWSKLEEIRSVLGTGEYGRVLAETYPRMEKISVDHGVLEKARDIYVVHGSFRWDDLGSWTALERVLPRNHEDNVVIGRHVGLDTSNCVIYGQEEKVVATIGIRDMIIAETEHGLLICPKSHSQDIRQLLTAIVRGETDKDRK